MLHLDPDRAPVPPRDAATLLVLRPGADGVEIFCVRRHAKSAFMGGAVVFPGGALDEDDAEPAYEARSTGLQERAALFARDRRHALALAVCACREALEEAELLPVTPGLDAASLGRLRAALAAGRPLAELLEDEGARLATADLVPFARWITPEAEQRRYDARFFVTALVAGQRGRHDEHETVSSLWATPARLLEAFEAGHMFLAPPTLRALELLLRADRVEAALALAAEQTLAPICPRFVPSDPPMLVLPGDPEHEVAERRVAGATRFVLRDGKFVSEDP
jgi:8-oxo-dGTP pyrophosphatase MutT (NUDIX family)